MSDHQTQNYIESCVFCQIATGRIPSIRIYEDSDFIAMMDISPRTEGHFLIITRGHYPLLADVPDELLAKVLPLARRLSSAAMTSLGVKGFNLVQNNGKAANQVVDHWHLHVIPRSDPSEIPLLPGLPADLTKLPFVAEKIRLNVT